MDKTAATHRVVYLTQSRVEEFVRVDRKTGKILEAGPMLQIYKGCTIEDVRARKLVTKVEDLAPILEQAGLVTLTDAE